MRIALAQIDSHVGDWEANVETMAAEARRAAAAGCNVVIFPELADLGGSMPAILEHACPTDAGPWRKLPAVAADESIHIVAGLAERAGDRVYNTLGVFSPTGECVAKYRKIHLFSAEPVREHEHLAAGDDLVVATLAGVCCGLMTCYDLRFPEMARALAMRGAELLIVPAAWPFPRLTHWKTLTAARAIENQLYLAAVNRTGTDGPLSFCGGSALYDPYGVAVTAGSEIGPALLVGDLHRDALRDTRARMQVFRDRRPDAYVRALSATDAPPEAPAS